MNHQNYLRSTATRAPGASLPAAGLLIAAAAAALGLAACEPGELDLLQPQGSTDGPQLSAFEATVTLSPADSALAHSLGWSDGVPDALVRILRNGTAEWLTARTDSAGVARFGELEPGLYYTQVRRAFDEAEAAAVGGVRRAFGDGSFVRVPTADTARQEYRLASDRRGDLVISEVSHAGPPPWEVPGAGPVLGGNYYFEVYNQGPTTRYLDGVVFGDASYAGFCQGCFNTCGPTEPVRTDPNGIYTRWLIAFPGDGTEYPIHPGEAKLIAAAAHDHTVVHEEMFDLSDADFEIANSAQANNPSVPDMVDISIRQFTHTRLIGNGSLYFLAEPFDPSTLPRPWRDGRGNAYIRVPTDLMFDIASIATIWPENDAEKPPCVPSHHPAIDRFPGGLLEIGLVTSTEVPVDTLSRQRPILRREGGVPILWDTNASAADWRVLGVTPGTLPDGSGLATDGRVVPTELDGDGAAPDPP